MLFIMSSQYQTLFPKTPSSPVPEQRNVSLLPVLFAREKHVTRKPFVHVVVALANLCVGMIVPKALSGTQVGSCHTRIFLEVEDALALCGEWATHTAETFRHVDLPPIGVIDWSECQMSVFDESQHIIVRPIENRVMAST